jgi:hypothetical protein
MTKTVEHRHPYVLGAKYAVITKSEAVIGSLHRVYDGEVILQEALSFDGHQAALLLAGNLVDTAAERVRLAARGGVYPYPSCDRTAIIPRHAIIAIVKLEPPAEQP